MRNFPGFRLLLCSLPFVWSAIPAGAAPTAGDPAPDFTLTDSRGVAHTLSDYSGQIVVLEWINHSCPFVRKHYDSENMQRMQEEAAENGITWFSICSSAPGKQGNLSPEKWNRTFDDYGAMPAAVLIDESGAVGRLYGARTTPQFAIIDADGVVVYTGAIDSISSADPADIEAATNYVDAALDSLLAGESVDVVSTKPYGCSVKY